MVPNVCTIVTKYITLRMIKKIKKQFKNENIIMVVTLCGTGEAFT